MGLRLASVPRTPQVPTTHYPGGIWDMACSHKHYSELSTNKVTPDGAFLIFPGAASLHDHPTT